MTQCAQPALFGAPKPPDLRTRGIDLRCCPCDDAEFIRDAQGAALVIADPPWSYVYHTGGVTRAENHYACVPTSQIVEHLNAFAAQRMALWVTEPLFEEWIAATVTAEREKRWRWGRSVSGGAWVKSGNGEASWDAADGANNDAGHYGAGYHWAGCEEPVRLYTADGSQTYRDVPLRNAWIEPPRGHSQKPVGWMEQWIGRWTMPGDLIVDPYAGLGSVAEAVMRAGGGRRYLGAEIDTQRHADACALLAQVRISA